MNLLAKSKSAPWLTMVFLALSALFACGGGGGGGSTPPPNATLTALAVTPALPSIAVGGTRQFAATGSYSDGTSKDLTASVTWSSATPAAATISAAGLATGMAGGSSLVSASQGSVSGNTTLTVTASAATLTSLTVSPATATVAKTATRQFTATGSYSDGSSRDVTSSVNWSSASPAVASVSTGGLVTGLGAGSATITATQGTVHGSGTVSITVPTLTALAVSPTQASVATGGSYKFTAVGTFSDGTSSPVAATWSSGNTAIATVNASTGLATGGSSYGSATITATLGSLTATGSIINNAPIPVSMVITPTTPTVFVGATVKLTASVTWSDGHVTDQSGPANWTTSSATIATVAGSTVTGKASGTATITATFSTVSSGSITNLVTDHVTVNVTSYPLTSLAVTPANSTLTVGGTLSLTATGTYGDGHTANLTAAASWTSSNTSVATVATNGGISAQSAGSATITATIGGITGTASVTVSSAATLTSITVAPANQTLSVGATSQYVATGIFSNGTGQTPFTGVTWTVSSGAVATTDAFGLVTAVGAGSTNVMATAGAVTGHAVLTVTAPPPTFDSRLVGNWQWLGTPDPDGNSYGSFYVFNANGTFTYDLIYLGSGINCIAFNKVIAHHEGTFSSLGSLSDLANAGKIIFTCTAHQTDYTSCGGATTPNAWSGTNPHFHWAAFADANHLVTNHTDDFASTGNLSHVKH